MLATGFTNSFTSGEIFPDAQDRVDIQPIAKGCDTATNLLVQIVGPLRKRRGFWALGQVYDQNATGRLIPFRRSIDDALMLEFGNLVVRVWLSDGSPLIDPDTGVQAQFASPYTTADLAGLRYRQIADVIYFRHNTGLQPQALERLTDTSWQFNVETFSNGPWLPENISTTSLTFSGGTVTTDQNPAAGDAGVTPAEAIMTGQTVSIVASAAVFTPGMVGDSFRIRAGDGAASIRSWEAGANTPVGWFILSVGNIYVSIADGGGSNKASASTPPVNTSGTQSDGCSTFQFLHDGAGIVQITSVASGTSAEGTVLATLPIGTQSTTYWARGAYGADIGWPRAWPSAVEERLVEGATASNLDMMDLTRTAGFTPVNEDFHPGLGTGLVVDTDALRRRLGDDGAEILWTRTATFVLAGTASGEYIVSGGLFGDPITPSTIVVRELSDYGSEDVYPAKTHKGITFVTRGGQTLRKMTVDPQQNIGTDDLSFLAKHIASLGMVQLAWLPQPDEVLWVRLATGGVAALTMHDEQQVRGWTTQQLGGGLVVEDIVTLPGPGRLETLWMIVSRLKNGATQRQLMMQSQVSDGLFMDYAELYEGSPTTLIGNLDYLAGETVRVLADGVQVPDTTVSNAGTLALPTAASKVLVGLAMPINFVSLKLDVATVGGTLLKQQRVAGVLVDLQAASCQVGLQGGRAETFMPRLPGDVGAVVSRKAVKNVTLAGDSGRDPRIVITEDSAYDFAIFSLKPQVTLGDR
jgi:hypothetical protein